VIRRDPSLGWMFLASAGFHIALVLLVGLSGLLRPSRYVIPDPYFVDLVSAPAPEKKERPSRRKRARKPAKKPTVKPVAKKTPEAAPPPPPEPKPKPEPKTEKPAPKPVKPKKPRVQPAPSKKVEALKPTTKEKVKEPAPVAAPEMVEKKSAPAPASPPDPEPSPSSRSEPKVDPEEFIRSEIERLEEIKRLEKVKRLREAIGAFETVGDEEPAEPVRAPPAPVSQEVKDAYYGEITFRLRELWVYTGTVRQTDRLEAEILIVLGPGGGVLQQKIVSGSGDPEFDRSVLRAIVKASPFPPPPRGLDREIQFRFRPEDSQTEGLWRKR